MWQSEMAIMLNDNDNDQWESEGWSMTITIMIDEKVNDHNQW